MKTREQIRQERRESRATWIVCVAILTVWIACLLCGTAEAACALPGVRTDEAVTGSFVWAWLFMRFIIWLDTPRGRAKKERQARGGELAAGETNSDERRSPRSF